MTTAIATRDEVRARLPIIRPVADIVTSYAVCIGDFLLYARIVYKGTSEAYCHYEADTSGIVTMDIQYGDTEDDALLFLTKDECEFECALSGNNDPIGELADMASGVRGYTCRLRMGVKEINEHIDYVIGICASHLSKA